jgi:hypothetical protein
MYTESGRREISQSLQAISSIKFGGVFGIGEGLDMSGTADRGCRLPGASKLAYLWLPIEVRFGFATLRWNCSETAVRDDRLIDGSPCLNAVKAQKAKRFPRLSVS